jgi:thymidylate synthase
MASLIKGNSLAEVWDDLLSLLISEGNKVSPRGMKTKELLGVTVSVSDMLNNVIVPDGRKMGYKFMVAEWLWMMSGRDDVYSISTFNQNIVEFSDDMISFYGAYGPRIVSQIAGVLSKLENDLNSRQAVIVIFPPNPKKSKDVPCTLSLQVFVRGDSLHGIVNMRSSDVWLGLPYDFFNFSMICNVIAYAMDIHAGSLTFNLGSSHLYEKNEYHTTKLGVTKSIYSPNFRLSVAHESRESPIERYLDLTKKLSDAFSMAVADTRTGLTAVHSPETSHGICELYYYTLMCRKNEEAQNVLTSFYTSILP